MLRKRCVYVFFFFRFIKWNIRNTKYVYGGKHLYHVNYDAKSTNARILESNEKFNWNTIFNFFFFQIWRTGYIIAFPNTDNRWTSEPEPVSFLSKMFFSLRLCLVPVYIHLAIYVLNERMWTKVVVNYLRFGEWRIIKIILSLFDSFRKYIIDYFVMVGDLRTR